jgi:hypothetical protein
MAAICWLRRSTVESARCVAFRSAWSAAPAASAWAETPAPASMSAWRRLRSPRLVCKVVWSPPSSSSARRRLERSSARRSVSSASCRFTRSSTTSRPEISRARKNCPSMKIDRRKTIDRRSVVSASTKPGQ